MSVRTRPAYPLHIWDVDYLWNSLLVFLTLWFPRHNWIQQVKKPVKFFLAHISAPVFYLLPNTMKTAVEAGGFSSFCWPSRWMYLVYCSHLPKVLHFNIISKMRLDKAVETKKQWVVAKGKFTQKANSLTQAHKEKVSTTVLDSIYMEAFMAFEKVKRVNGNTNPSFSANQLWIIYDQRMWCYFWLQASPFFPIP